MVPQRHIRPGAQVRARIAARSLLIGQPVWVDPRTEIVARGYDHVADAYASWQPSATDVRRAYVDRLRSAIPTTAAVLDLGCGTGAHATARLSTDFRVVGVDISERSLRLARRALPNASFVLGDIGSIAFAPRSFDAVVAFFSLIHVPRSEHAEVVRQISSWLKPGGWFIATMGAGAGHEGVAQFLGVEMFWSSWDVETSVNLVRDAGLDMVESRDESEQEDAQPATHRWIVAKRPS